MEKTAGNQIRANINENTQWEKKKEYLYISYFSPLCDELNQ